MYKVQTNYCLILIKKLLDEIDWAHNFVQYVKQEFDALLFQLQIYVLSTMVLNYLIDIDKDLNNMLSRSNVRISCSNKLHQWGSLEALHFTPVVCIEIRGT